MIEVEERLNLKVEYTIIKLTDIPSPEFTKKYGLGSIPGNLIFSDDVSRDVILQKCEMKKREFYFNYRHGNIHKPYMITMLDKNEDYPFYRVLPYYTESLQSYFIRNKDKHVYSIVLMKDYAHLAQHISFSEEFKSRLLEIFKGIKVIHDKGHTHGSISDTTMIICAIDRIHIGKVIGTSLGPSGDPKDDWKAVATFLENINPKKNDKSSSYDSEILDLIDLLNNKNNNATDELVIDHIALWLAPQKRALINSIQDNMFGKHISLTKMNTIGGDFNWQNKIDTAIKNTIIKRCNYTTDILGLVKFVRNSIEHGHTIFPDIENDMRDTFEYNEKGILGMIDKALPRLFINILNEAKDAKLSIPKY